MLSNLEYKILQVLYDLWEQKQKLERIEELEFKTGRSKKDIERALSVLEQKKYIIRSGKCSKRDYIIFRG
ncbi:hypothetical protein G9G63_20360 [Paenibacillus sp. EKM202P]|uniref:hypothetical protein n=1 Tax=unclassified Paenibacillus TaxID=185978 RepID=UPI0013EA80C0|nr:MULTISPECIES: hypothetical protein [unclassified Paenibacillus]KAF6562003.1 hypothetical protein G9G63_20360 [Paenibacillus sp. EKM202P]KAF6566291.1 hypothetical protein G9G64_19495 [Paenibacillus sp. EKM207P]